MLINYLLEASLPSAGGAWVCVRVRVRVRVRAGICVSTEGIFMNSGGRWFWKTDLDF